MNSRLLLFLFVFSLLLQRKDERKEPTEHNFGFGLRPLHMPSLYGLNQSSRAPWTARARCLLWKSEFTGV